MSASETRFGKATRSVLLLPLVAALAHLPASAQEWASLRLEPAMVLSEEEVNALGSGFCGETTCPPVTIRLQGVVVAEDILPRPDGAFEARFIAEAGPGKYVVTASQVVGEGVPEQQQGHATVATAELTIQLGPRLYLRPSAVRPGEHVTVMGAGFSGEFEADVVTVRLGEEVVVDRLEVREDGTLEARIAVLVEAGPQRVSVTMTTADGESLEVGVDLTVGVGEQTPGPRETEDEPPPIGR